MLYLELSCSGRAGGGGGLAWDGQPSKAWASFGGSSLQAPGGGHVVKLPRVYEALVTVFWTNIHRGCRERWKISEWEGPSGRGSISSTSCSPQRLPHLTLGG